jgi:benzil reductase ((S)-benzoin forming)
MSHYIITGTSRGIGEAIAVKMLKPGNTLFCASRTLNEELVERAVALGVTIYYYTTDLSDPLAVAGFSDQIWEKIAPEDVKCIALINNAGMIAPIGPIENNDPVQLLMHIQLNLLAPMLLTSAFLKHTTNWNVPKVVFNISSGAAGTPYSGWSVYCSSKAAIDMFTRTVAQEQTTAKFPAKILAFAPGIVETALQTEIRGSDPENFPQKDKFVKLHEDGHLFTPEFVAETISNALFDDSILQGSVIDIWQLKQ